VCICWKLSRKWIKKFEQPLFATKRDLSTAKDRSFDSLLDETKVKRNGKIVYASACLDLERREVISRAMVQGPYPISIHTISTSWKKKKKKL
jgi:hypothetical protein